MLEKGRLFIFDTAVLSNFALVNRIDLIEQRYGNQGALTSEVLAEIAAGIVSGYEKLSRVNRLVLNGLFQELTLSKDERKIFINLLNNLSSGEASCIAAATVRNSTVVSDDRLARSFCEELKVRFTGTIGILVTLTRDKVLSENKADAILDAMVNSGFYSPVRRISDVL